MRGTALFGKPFYEASLTGHNSLNKYKKFVFQTWTEHGTDLGLLPEVLSQ